MTVSHSGQSIKGRIARLVLLLLAALGMTSAAMADTPTPVRNWNTNVSETAEGGHKVGNPLAKLKLMEFVSYTCSHCAHFEKESDAALRLYYLVPGKISIEVRPVIRNGIDLVATTLVNCGPKEKFFLNHAAFLRGQEKWLPKAQNLSEAQRARWASPDYGTRMRAVAADLGFYTIMESRGYRRTDVDRCLNDEQAARHMVDQANTGSQVMGVTGTPSFAINGILLDGVHTWATLQTAITGRLAS
ncbi:MAG: DsbA family protein [Novosphingobium sp.]